MKRRKRSQVPAYRKHRPSGQAVVTLNGRDFYLGPHGTRTSKAEYDRLVGEWMTQGRVFETDDSPTVTEVCVAYWRHAKTY